ncbi:iron ABC transporter substrate-binding protein [Candidatus Lucifugimonas marina]|uniref:Extracellular solute-binding protein n=1 Tax=Candidatus Lucifugimonas marina TaxID=3038979 RepID=A0AAJ6CSL9_9CHLR|nr:extracellular solute-binding protein [SAR202 cluster bacterium JH702]MDG0870827.1 extracellular solute-binding protein [SAR202 cluster bacterium JH639]WFG36453.1 extracellular solute-binding protein [SAR202 cluster bacterium JH545]WFG40386.1 extracellular solute-binding protein [SAR202 cluster bacterium JH1073]
MDKSVASLWRVVVTVALISVLVVAAISCAAGDESGESDDSKSLVVYSGRSESLIAPLITDFEEVTGAKVEVNYGSTGPLAATLLEEGDNSPADVFFAQDPGGLGAVDSLLAELPADILSSVPDWAQDPENKWVGTSGRARVIVYNTDMLTEADLPDSIEDFAKPEWKGRIGWPPTNGSLHAMITAMRQEWGEDRTKAWLEGIVANEPKIYAKNTPTVAAAGAGEIEVGFVNHYYLHRFIAEEGESFAARNYYTRAADPGSVVLVAGVGLLEESDNKDLAEQFIKFLLSASGQQYFASQTYEFPLNENAKPNNLLPALEEITKPSIDLGDLIDLAGTQDLLREVGALP